MAIKGGWPVAGPEPDRTENGLTVGWGKWWAKARGTHVIVALALIALVALGWREFDRLARAATEDHGRIVAAQDALAQEFRFLSYLLSIPAEERPRLVPPPGFWERVERPRGERGPR